MNSFIKILFLIVPVSLSFGYSSVNVKVLKHYSADKVFYEDSIIVTVEIQNLEDDTLHGFFYTEFFPNDIIVNNINVKTEDSEITNYIFESDAFQFFDGLKCYRWVFEVPPDFPEENFLEKNKKIFIEYSLSSELPNNYKIGNYNWSGYFSSLGGAFGYSDSLELKEIIFLDRATPVDLISFNAEMNDNKVLLNWITASSINVSGFILEKCNTANKSEFIEIAFIPVKENSISYSSYEYIDKNLSGSNEFIYRLKEVDFNGNKSLLAERIIKILTKEFILYQNYPNPFNPSTIISFYLPSDSYVQLIIYSHSGEEIYKLIDDFLKSGFHKIDFNIKVINKNLSSGVYFYLLKSANLHEVKKFLLLK